jgi:hypothetical protein
MPIKNPHKINLQGFFKLIVSDFVICRISQTSNVPNSMLS